jgi:hypothetical protein
MFLRYFVTIARPSEDVEAAFEGGVENWMPALVQEADESSAHILSELGFKVANARIQKDIEVTIGSRRRTDGATLIPIQWHAASTSSLFPVLEGQLEIAGLGAATTQLGLSATYEPPFGMAGRVADRALLHRIAEVAVKGFLDSVGERLRPPA